MKGNPEVINCLNEALSLELSAVNQYWIHYRLFEDWGYTKLAAKEREESIEEMHHADKLIERIIFLESTPHMQTAPLKIGKSIKEILENDLAGEHEAWDSYTKSRKICNDAGDYVTMKIFEDLIIDEEGHIDFLETQLSLLSELGAERYGLLNAQSADAGEE